MDDLPACFHELSHVENWQFELLFVYHNSVKTINIVTFTIWLCFYMYVNENLEW